MKLGNSDSIRSDHPSVLGVEVSFTLLIFYDFPCDFCVCVFADSTTLAASNLAQIVSGSSMMYRSLCTFPVPVPFSLM
uniref:Uncharacterized protein n=1 Tax=Arundo donax TaxID=35708 RepID=A0A0A9G8D5_ARUDO